MSTTKVAPTNKFPFPSEFLFNMHEANYAVSTDGSDHLIFLRLALIRPRKDGRRRVNLGCITVQTQHSDDWILRFTVHPNGNFIRHTGMRGDEMSMILASVLVDQRGAAARYGQKLGKCCRCNKSLTDERSRWYGIGPECEKHWPEIVYESDETRGVFVPSMAAVQ